MSQLIVKNLCLGYDNMTVSQDINFQVNKGDYLCIVGENGSGKSTLVKTLVGLTPPLSGQIIRGDGLAPSETGYLPQQTPVQKDFPASVGEIVLSGFLASSGFRPFYTAAQKKQAMANMERLGIADKKNDCYRDLSGGQQQRVLLARALCATRKMLLLDEPVSGLDPAATAEMYEIIQRLNKEDHTTIIMVSHDIESAVKYSSHILHMGSRLQFFGTKEDYVKTPLKTSFRSQSEGLSKLVDEAELCTRASALSRNRRYYK
ncbi:MAG: ABC transporter ATP-binding protein [Firmicutes bacterium]|nr:ABC transporter ATP-binding protein [Bacillota bacterium]